MRRALAHGLALLAILALVLATSPALSATSADRININKATAAELQALPGIGPAKAQAIVDFRTANGPFKKVDDLVNVRGIGQKTLEKLRPLVTVGGAAAPAKIGTAPGRL